MAFFQDVIRATFHVPQKDRKARKSSSIPESFLFQAENLLVEIFPEAGETQDSRPIREARAWGAVSAKGGKYQILSTQAIYRQESSSVTFRGTKGNPPQLLPGGNVNQSDPLVLQITAREFKILTPRGSGRIKFNDLKPILEAFDKGERAPPP